MNGFVNEIFSLQIDPPKGNSNGRCVTYSLYANGVFVVMTSLPYSEDESRIDTHAFRVTTAEETNKIAEFGQLWRERFQDCPSDIALPDFSGSPFNLSLFGKLINGSWFRLDPALKQDETTYPKTLLKRMEWNSRSVDFLDAYFALVQAIAPTHLVPLPSCDESDYLRPVPRFLMALCLNDSVLDLRSPKSVDEAIKFAAKKAFQDTPMPEGKLFHSIAVLFKQHALVLLEQSLNREEFDQGHSLLVRSLCSLKGNALSYGQIAYWLDWTFLFLLLSQHFIVFESKMAYLHAPIAPKDLQAEEENTDEVAYLFLEREGRKEWALLHISPAYFFLESLYSNAHPTPGKNVSNKA